MGCALDSPMSSYWIFSFTDGEEDDAAAAELWAPPALPAVVPPVVEAVGDRHNDIIPPHWSHLLRRNAFQDGAQTRLVSRFIKIINFFSSMICNKNFPNRKTKKLNLSMLGLHLL